VSSASPLARSIAGLLWPLFLACSALLAVVWIGGVNEGTFSRIGNAELRAALEWCARGIDVVWLMFGAIVAYFALVRAEGLSVARGWAGAVLAAGFLLGAASAWSGWPLGPVHFTTRLGWKLGPVPFGLPALWLVIVVGARETVLRWRPRASHNSSAALTGLLCLVNAANLDPIVWKIRFWWVWYPAQRGASALPPTQNFICWLLAGAALAWWMRSPHVVPRVARRSSEPVIALALLNAIALLTHLTRLWR
jgi:uncharacterized membrane protein